ncbi:hypothetical protein CHARACLAT_031821, partial [Characodon lateralis]|nr:hypothetical protein [Characodon lateralis]
CLRCAINDDGLSFHVYGQRKHSGASSVCGHGWSYGSSYGGRSGRIVDVSLSVPL